MSLKKIIIKDLYKKFHKKQIFNGLSLEISSAESHVIIGGSGSGKSVLMKTILGLIAPDSGEILIDGFNILSLNEQERIHFCGENFGVLFQGAALFDSLKIWENVAFKLLYAQKLSPRKALDIAVEKLSLVGLSNDISYLYPFELSGGMQKRVALARAIASSPSVLFFDEPTTGLDPIMADTINNLIANCVHQGKLTSLAITHDMQSAKKIGHSLSMLYQGKFIWTGLMENIDSSGNPYLDQFIHGKAQGPIQMHVDPSLS